MKTISKILPLSLSLLVVVVLASYDGFVSPSGVSPTIETRTAVPTATFTATLFLPTTLPPTATSTPVSPTASIPVSGTPTVIVMENGLTWTECVVPVRDYAHVAPDEKFASKCLGAQIPVWDDNDREMAGKWVVAPNSRDNEGVLQQEVNGDVYTVKQIATGGCCKYEFLKNGKVLMEKYAPLVTFTPCRHLWAIDGKVVWEFVGEPPTIIVDGVDVAEKYSLDGAFKPYVIHGKLIYIAKQKGKYYIVYDGKMIEPAFDDIYIKYCCATTNVRYGQGQYWFWGKRNGTYYVVSIH